MYCICGHAEESAISAGWIEAGRSREALPIVIMYRAAGACNMKIDVDKLSENELIELNHRIVERLKFLESVRRHEEMMEFSIGDKVSFSPSSREKQFGVLIKYNKKTVSVVTEQGEPWKVKPVKGRGKKKGKLIKLHKVK